MAVGNDLDEVDVRTSAGGEGGAVAYRRAAPCDVDSPDALDELDVMRRAGVEKQIFGVYLHSPHVDHPEAYLALGTLDPQQFGRMGAVYADEALPHSADAQMVGEQRDAPAAVPAHGRFAAVGVEIAHAELLRRVALEDHQAVGSDAGSAPAQGGHPLGRGVERLRAAVDHDEVVSGSVIFAEFPSHASRARPISAAPTANMAIFRRKPSCFGKNNGYL